MSLTVKIRGDASQFEKTMRGVKGTIGGLSSKIAGIGVAAAGAAAGYITLSKAIEFVKSSSEKAASIEDLAMQFEVLTGSATKSAELLKAFREEEKKSALSTQDYAIAAKTFLAFGGSLEDTLPSLRMLADVSMGNSERFGSLALAFAQTTAAGRLMGQEVLQFVNAGFNPLEQIARDTGESMAVLKKRMEDGGISVKMVREAFKNATSEGGRFFGAIDKGSATTNAKINQTEAAVTQLQVAFGTGFNEGLKDALDAANNFLPQLEGKFKMAGELVGNALTDALSGDMRKFQVIGEFIGAVLAQGVAVGFEKVVMGPIEKVLVDYADFFANESRARSSSAANQIMDKALAENDPETRKRLGEIGMRIAQGNLSESSVSEKYQLGAEYQKIGAPSFTDRIQPQLEALKLEMAISNAMSKSIDQSMPQAVREGILEAQRREMVNQAKFSN